MLLARCLALSGLAVLAACSKASHSAPAPDPGAAATAAPAPTAPVVWRLTVLPAGAAHVDLPGPKLHLEGDTTAAQGFFDVTPTDLAATRGGLMIDLTTLAMRASGAAADAGQTAETKAAGAWLETRQGPNPNASYRYASFAIRSVDGLSATDLTKVDPTKDGGDDVRAVTMTAHGDLLIHGHKLQRDAKLGVTFRHPSGAPANSRPARVDVTSTEPARVGFDEIDLRPRDGVTGKVVALAANLAGKLADHADVRIDVRATPAP